MNRLDFLETACTDQGTRRLVLAACRAALTAGFMLRELYGKPHEITMKGEINLVTEADFAAESAITASLGEDTPEIAILAEESADEKAPHQMPEREPDSLPLKTHWQSSL